MLSVGRVGVGLRTGDDPGVGKAIMAGLLIKELIIRGDLKTAAPHSGKPEDFQLFMGPIDPDRLEGEATEEREDADAGGRSGLVSPQRP